MAQVEIAVGERGFCALNQTTSLRKAANSLPPAFTEKLTATHEICGLGSRIEALLATMPKNEADKMRGKLLEAKAKT